MYIRHLTIDKVKRFRDFRLSFDLEDGNQRKVTVVIGENGVGKSMLLQAIGLAAAGDRFANTISTSRWRDSFVDVRVNIDHTNTIMSTIVAEFMSKNECIYSKISKLFDTNLLSGFNYHTDLGEEILSAQTFPNEQTLHYVRDTDEKGYFVAAYGTNRFLSTTIGEPRRRGHSIERLQSLFPMEEGFGRGLTSLQFVERLADSKEQRLQFSKTLNLVMKELGLFEELKSIELRGAGGIKSSQDLSNRFAIKIGKESYKLPTLALSHGFQSTLAWVADLIGHLILDGQPDPQTATGLVLVDEIDLYLHPPRQVRLIRALKKTFPKLQFVVTTHSPLVLCGIDPYEDQVVRLVSHPETGDIVAEINQGEDPRILSGGALLQQYFGIDAIHPDADHRLLREYLYLAANPYRNKSEEKKLDKWQKELSEKGVRFDPTRVPRGTP